MTGQSNADGIPLGRVELDQLADVCEVVWKKILVQWAGPGYNSKPSTLAELLACELGDSFRPGGWLHDWAQRHGLLVPAFLDCLTSKGRCQSVAAVRRGLARDPSGARLSGGLDARRSARDNVLVPVDDGKVHSADFRLIDLATYNGQTPLSRDLAALLVAWEDCDLRVALQLPGGSFATAMVVVDATLTGHRLWWHPFDVEVGPSSSQGAPTVIPHWGSVQMFEDPVLLEPVAALLAAWRELRREDVAWTTDWLQQAGFTVSRAAPAA